MSVAQLIRDIALPFLYLRARRYSQIMQNAKSEGVDLADGVASLKYFLHHADLEVDKESLEKVSSEDFIEIYDTFAVQIYRSFNLYKYSTFSTQELFEKRMDQLYSRPELFNKMLFRAANKIFSGSEKFITGFCPTHVVTERKDIPSTVEISYKFMAPVYDEFGRVTGVICCEKLKLIEKGAQISEDEVATNLNSGNWFS